MKNKNELIQNFINLVNKIHDNKLQDIISKTSAIKVPPNGQIVLFDKEDENKVLPYNWILDKNGYVIRHSLSNEKDLYGSFIRLHRWILNLTAKDKIVVDHINGIPWDNRKSNLRLATKSENSQNTKLALNNTSNYKGVSHRITKNNRQGILSTKDYWSAYIYINGKKKVKLFPYTNYGLQQAVAWYDAMALKYYKEFAKTNEMIKNQSKIEKELNYIIQNLNINNITIHKVSIKTLSGYSYIRTVPNRNQYIVQITINHHKYMKIFRYNNAGKILALEYLNQILKDNNRTDLNKIDYTVITKEELEAEREYMKNKEIQRQTSKYLGVCKFHKVYKYKNGKMYEKDYWKACITKNNKSYTKHFPYTSDGEIAAAKFYNQKAIELFGDR